MIKTRKEAEKEARRLGLEPKKCYWCKCCEAWAHIDDPCDCAYQMCSGKCQKLNNQKEKK